jgi:2-phospho-L-lactate/phosphoenolpyruvate guanylyltransferase
MGLDESVTPPSVDVRATGGWAVILPVKGLSAAKSRMAAGPREPGELALAFFRDALTAALATPRVAQVIVATSDDRVRAAAESAGAVVIDDAGHAGINAAARWAAAHWAAAPDAPTSHVAVMVSDLPCLTPDALDAALGLAEGHPASFVTDLDGVGTTLWCATEGHAVDPHFGPGSRAAHLAAGAVDLVAAHPSAGTRLEPLRCDVDTEAALQHARGLRPGAATLAALATPR